MENTEAMKTVVAEDVEIVGSVKCESPIQIDGKLNGDLSCSGNAVIGQTAVVKGNISADSTTIMGQINGNISAKDRIELKSTARVNGDIRARRLTVEDGVTFVGKSEVNPAGTGGRPAATDAKPGKDAAGADPSPSATEEDAEEKNKSGMFSRK